MIEHAPNLGPRGLVNSGFIWRWAGRGCRPEDEAWSALRSTPQCVHRGRLSIS